MNTAAPAWWQTRGFAVAMTLLAAVPLLWPTVPPLTDLPGHIGRYRVMLATDADTLGQWYRFDWKPIGNLGVDVLVRVLAPMIGLEPAVKAIVIAIPMMTVAGILWVSREAHGRIQPWAIAALPLAYAFPFQFGFVNNALSLALALNAFALWLRWGRERRLRLRALLFAPIGLIVWGAHITGWGVLGLLAFGSELARLRESGARWSPALAGAALACAPLALPMALILVWRSGEGMGETGGFFLWGRKLGWLGMTLRDRWLTLDVASSILLALLAYHGWRDRDTGRSRAMVYGAILLLAAFVLMPYLLFGSAHADMRLAPPLVMMGLLSLGAGDDPRDRRQAAIATIALAFVLVRLVASTASFALYDRGWQSHLAAIDHLPRGARVATFVGEPCRDSWANRRLTHMAGLVIARRAGFANDQWRLGAGSPLTVVAHIPGYDSDPSQIVTGHDCPAVPDARPVDTALRGLPRDRFDYLWLITPPPADPHLFAGLRPVWRNATDTLYQIDHARLSQVPSTH